MKRILIFSLAYYPHVGGAEVAIKEITDRITDIEWHVVTMRFAREERVEKVGNVTVHRVGYGSSYLSKILFVPLAALTYVRLDRLQRFDAIWGMMTYMLFPITLLHFFGGMRIPYAITLQDGDPFERVFKRWYIIPFAWLLRIGFSHARIVTAISTHLALWVTAIRRTNDVRIIPNGVDLSRFVGAHEPHEGTVLITTSRLVHKNAVDTVIRALPLLPTSVRFQVLGDGPGLLELRGLATELGVLDRVEFVGYVDHTDMPAYLHRADIFIRPSRSEGQGASFMEAMGAALPVIATQVGGIADFLFDEVRNPSVPPTGWAVDVDSPEQIAEQVRKILADPDKTRAVVATARTLVTERYDWNMIAKDMREKVFILL